MQMADRLGWKVLYARPRLPDTRGALCTCIEHGRWQVLAAAPHARASLRRLHTGWHHFARHNAGFSVAKLTTSFPSESSERSALPPVNGGKAQVWPCRTCITGCGCG